MFVRVLKVGCLLTVRVYVRSTAIYCYNAFVYYHRILQDKNATIIPANVFQSLLFILWTNTLLSFCYYNRRYENKKYNNYYD